mmetsp:Transcript_34745/g.103069  ORF Transcript_34745/g.103069 Transcript_34745/m.103069 type:complete len:218 (-) Transcript_34745:335-988(-)
MLRCAVRRHDRGIRHERGAGRRAAAQREHRILGAVAAEHRAQPQVGAHDLANRKRPRHAWVVDLDRAVGELRGVARKVVDAVRNGVVAHNRRVDWDAPRKDLKARDIAVEVVAPARAWVVVHAVHRDALILGAVKQHDRRHDVDVVFARGVDLVDCCLDRVDLCRRRKPAVVEQRLHKAGRPERRLHKPKARKLKEHVEPQRNARHDDRAVCQQRRV